MDQMETFFLSWTEANDCVLLYTKPPNTHTHTHPTFSMYLHMHAYITGNIRAYIYDLRIYA